MAGIYPATSAASEKAPATMPGRGTGSIPANVAYSTYARATASRRDNLRRTADELSANADRAVPVGLRL